MLKNLDFDPTFYFGIVADNLLTNHGAQAVHMSMEALKKMRELGDSEGYELWEGVQAELMKRLEVSYVPEGELVH